MIQSFHACINCFTIVCFTIGPAILPELSSTVIARTSPNSISTKLHKKPMSPISHEVKLPILAQG